MDKDKEQSTRLMQLALCDHIMRQAQVFASAWALVGGKFDDGSGSMLKDAEAAKQELREMLAEFIDTNYSAMRAHIEVSTQLAGWFAEIAALRIKHQDPLPVIDRFIAKHVKVMAAAGSNLH
jgi:hypothetical protein